MTTLLNTPINVGESETANRAPSSVWGVNPVFPSLANAVVHFSELFCNFLDGIATLTRVCSVSYANITFAVCTPLNGSMAGQLDSTATAVDESISDETTCV